MIRLFTLILVLFACSGLAAAQTKVKDPIAVLNCSVSVYTFKCPKGYEVKNAKGGTEPFMAFHAADKIAVFAFSPSTLMKEDEVVRQSLLKSFALQFGSDFENLRIKESNDFSGDEKWSRFEVSKFAKAALDEKQKLAFHFQYVYLKFKNKQIVVGFIYDPAVQNPTDWFNRWSGGGFGDASNALQNLIVSITKEKRPEFSPGGPPPPGLAKVTK